MPSPAVVLYDGRCNLCNASVRFIIGRDPQGQFRFAPLQSEAGRRLLATCPPALQEADSVVLIENGRCHAHSTAALRVLRRLRGPWLLLYGFIAVPPLVRNAVYHLISRNRHRWFGRSEDVQPPAPGHEDRYLL